MIFLANVFFEYEIAGSKSHTLVEIFNAHPLFRQLQYLPLIFLSSQDTLLVSELPKKEYLHYLKSVGLTDLPQIEAISHVKGDERILKSWASSKLIKSWADEKGFSYDMPFFDIAAEINSKIFSYQLCQKLPFSKLVQNQEDLFLEDEISTWVLKTAQGFSGLGNFIFKADEKNLAMKFCEKEWQKGNVLILEPWVERVLDFSSQWQIEEKPHLLGITKCLNHLNGGYVGTDAGDQELLFGSYQRFVEEHIEYCKQILKTCIGMHYFGPLGVDAMVYKDFRGDLKLHPVVEINARMTMSAACLLSWRKYFHQYPLSHWKLEKNRGSGFLPDHFKRQLTVSF